jgi:uncharacterized membrane protein
MIKSFLTSLFKKRSEALFLAVSIFLYTAVLGYFAIQRHNAFASGYDLANMDQTIWNSLHGRFFAFSQGGETVTRFTTHTDVILVLLAPLYVLWNDVRMLLIFQSFVIALGAIPTYLIAHTVTKNKLTALFVVTLYLLNPGAQWIAIYDFHAVSLAIPLLLLVFYFGYIGKWRWYFIAAIFASLTKEQVPVTVGAIGLALALLGKKRVVGILTFCIGILLSLFLMRYFIPYFNTEGIYKFSPWYGHFVERTVQNRPVDLPLDLVKNYLLTPGAWTYYNLLIRPFAYLPLLGFPFLIISLPDLLINLLSDHAQMRSITMHYDSVIVPGLVISTIFGMYWYQTLIRRVLKRSLLRDIFIVVPMIGALILAMRFNYHYNPTPTAPTCWCRAYDVSEEDREFEALLRTIPESASVTASPEIRPHITHRENAYTMPDATSSADFIAVIDQNRLPGDYNPKDFELELIRVLDESTAHTLVKKIGHFYLYKRN